MKESKGISIRNTLFFSSYTCVHRWTWKSLPSSVEFERSACANVYSIFLIYRGFMK